MRKLSMIATLALGFCTTSANAGIIYQLVESGTGNVKATLEFDPATSGASDSSTWIAPTGASLASLLTGGISGFMVDFGGGLEAATGGDLSHLFFQEFFSGDGSLLDFGFYWDSVSSISFASGSIGRVTADNFSGSDTIASLDFSFAVNGDWVLGEGDTGSDPVPAPAALGFLGLGLACLGIARRRRSV